MTPLKALVGLVALLFDAFFGKKTGWPDGEQPLIDPPQEYPPDWALTWGDAEVSAGSAREARVDVAAEGPVGAGVRSLAPTGTTNITPGLLISAAIGLREYTTSGDCEAPTYWSAIADQLDPK